MLGAVCLAALHAPIMALHAPIVTVGSLAPHTVSRAAVCLAEGLDAVSIARLQEDAKKLSSDAAALLEEVNGDAEKARTSYMGYTLAFVKEEMPELYDRIKTDPTHPDAHRALVEITWDAIAAFLPVTHSSKLTEAAQKKLTAVARAGCDGTSDSPMATLDVGCGNGLLLPFLLACDAPASAYRGIDVSDGMIERAKAAHENDPLCAGARFEGMSFGELLEEKDADSSVSFDSIFFNGAIRECHRQGSCFFATLLPFIDHPILSCPLCRVLPRRLAGDRRRGAAALAESVFTTGPLAPQWGGLCASGACR